MGDILKLTDEQIRAAREAYGGDPECLHLMMHAPHGALIHVATITRPIDYESLVGKACLVRMDSRYPWEAHVLARYHATPSHRIARFEVFGSTSQYFVQCRPFEPNLVGKVTDDE